jgi:hypothetical protein
MWLWVLFMFSLKMPAVRLKIHASRTAALDRRKIFVFLLFDLEVVMSARCFFVRNIQDRNVHGKIFGGYIMKKAFEIAHVAAVRLCAQ